MIACPICRMAPPQWQLHYRTDGYPTSEFLYLNLNVLHFPFIPSISEHLGSFLFASVQHQSFYLPMPTTIQSPHLQCMFCTHQLHPKDVGFVIEVWQQPVTVDFSVHIGDENYNNPVLWHLRMYPDPICWTAREGAVT